jgi:hypothetical protein
MEFSLMQLLKENQPINGIERYVDLQLQDLESFSVKYLTINDTFYKFNIEINIDKKYFWIYCNFNSPTPRDDELIHIHTGEIRENSRTNEEVELTHQFFGLYDFHKQFFYISNTKKSSIVKEFFKFNNISIELKNIYINFDDFVETLENIGEVSFTNHTNLFNQDNLQRRAITDLTGTGAPDSFLINATYSNEDKSSLINWIKSLRLGDSAIKEKLIVKGLDESGFKRIYNSSTFTEKIKVDCNKGKDGKYTSENVLSQLLKKVEHER